MSLDPQSGLLSADTNREAEQLQVQRWRAMSAADKLRVVGEMNAAVDVMALAGIRLRHPLAPPREQFLRLAILKLGRELAGRAYPEIASLDAT